MSTERKSIDNDNRIMNIVTYAVTKGGVNNPLTQEMASEYSVKTLKTFAEFKSLIRRGEFTIDELADHVYSKYGV